MVPATGGLARVSRLFRWQDFLLLGVNDGFCYSSLLNKPDVSVFQKRPEWLKTRALNLLCRIAGQS